MPRIPSLPAQKISHQPRQACDSTPSGQLLCSRITGQVPATRQEAIQVIPGCTRQSLGRSWCVSDARVASEIRVRDATLTCPVSALTRTYRRINSSREKCIESP